MLTASLGTTNACMLNEAARLQKINNVHLIFWHFTMLMYDVIQARFRLVQEQSLTETLQNRKYSSQKLRKQTRYTSRSLIDSRAQITPLIM